MYIISRVAYFSHSATITKMSYFQYHGYPKSHFQSYIGRPVINYLFYVCKIDNNFYKYESTPNKTH